MVSLSLFHQQDSIYVHKWGHEAIYKPLHAWVTTTIWRQFIFWYNAPTTILVRPVWFSFNHCQDPTMYSLTTRWIYLASVIARSSSPSLKKNFWLTVKSTDCWPSNHNVDCLQKSGLKWHVTWLQPPTALRAFYRGLATCQVFLLHSTGKRFPLSPNFSPYQIRTENVPLLLS